MTECNKRRERSPKTAAAKTKIALIFFFKGLITVYCKGRKYLLQSPRDKIPIAPENKTRVLLHLEQLPLATVTKMEKLRVVGKPPFARGNLGIALQKYPPNFPLIAGQI